MAEHDSIQHLNFDPELPCGWLPDKKCYNNALWVIKNRCCGSARLACDWHKKQWVTLINNQIRVGTAIFTCTECGKRNIRADTINDMTEIKRVKGNVPWPNTN